MIIFLCGLVVFIIAFGVKYGAINAILILGVSMMGIGAIIWARQIFPCSPDDAINSNFPTHKNS